MKSSFPRRKTGFQAETMKWVLTPISLIRGDKDTKECIEELESDANSGLE